MSKQEAYGFPNGFVKEGEDLDNWENKLKCSHVDGVLLHRRTNFVLTGISVGPVKSWGSRMEV